MNTKGIGIIGTGAIALKHAQAIAELEGARVLGLFNPNPKSAEAARSRFSEPVFSDLDGFLGMDGLDVVCVCTPSGMHLEPGLAAIRAGKHLVVEKPIEIDLARADQLIEAAEQKGVKLAVIFQNRFSPDYQKLKQAVDAGVFGRLLMGNAYVNWFRNSAYYSGSTWKGTLKADGGGALINQGIHTIDLLLDLMGGVKTVYGQVQTALYPIEGEDLGAALVNFKNGALGNITAATALYPGYPERIEIFGTEGSAILEGGKLTAWNVRDQPPLDLSSANASASGSSDPNAIGIQLHLDQWRLFLDALDSDQAVVVDGKTARKSVELIRAIYESSRIGQPVEL